MTTQRTRLEELDGTIMFMNKQTSLCTVGPLSFTDVKGFLACQYQVRPNFSSVEFVIKLVRAELFFAKI